MPNGMPMKSDDFTIKFAEGLAVGDALPNIGRVTAILPSVGVFVVFEIVEWTWSLATGTGDYSRHVLVRHKADVVTVRT